MQQRPVGICSVCGNYAYKQDEIGRDCHARHHGETCNGMVRDAGNPADWEQCPACSARGYGHEVDCPQCGGAGWLYSVAPRT